MTAEKMVKWGKKKAGGVGEKRSRRKRDKMRTQQVSNSETTANKSQSVELLKVDAWIISQCQVKWLPVSPHIKTPPLCSLLLTVPYLVMSHCILLNILPQTCDGGKRGVADARKSPLPGLDK